MIEILRLNLTTNKDCVSFRKLFRALLLTTKNDLVDLRSTDGICDILTQLLGVQSAGNGCKKHDSRKNRGFSNFRR